MTPALVGAAVGPAMQLQQPALWDAWAYGAMVVAALALVGIARRVRPRVLPALLVAALLSFGLCGLRAVDFSSRALDPSLEGRDIAVTGVVAAMPQRNESGLRFRFEVESATAGGAAVRVPPQVYLGWYGGAIPDPNGLMELQRLAPELQAGDRWQMTVRLKAPHGNSNPAWLRLRTVAVGAGLAGDRLCARRPARHAAPAPGRDVAPSGGARAPVGARRRVRAGGGPQDGRLAGRADRGRPERHRPCRLGRVPRHRRGPPDEHLGLAHHHVRLGRRLLAWAGCGGAAGACAWPGRRSTRPWSAACCWRRAMPCSAAGACRRNARCGCWRRWACCACPAGAGPGRRCGCWPARWW